MANKSNDLDGLNTQIYICDIFCRLDLEITQFIWSLNVYFYYLLKIMAYRPQVMLLS